jgi:hypothetical protein
MRWDIVATGIVVALNPLSIACYILLLSSPRGVAKGLAFLAGWAASIVAVIALTLALTDGTPPRPTTAPAKAVSGVVVLLGVAFIVAGQRFYRRLHAPAVAKPPPRWMGKLDTMPLWGAASLGVLIQPWPFVAAGAALVSSIDTGDAASLAYLAAFALLSCFSFIVMQAYVVVAHDVALPRLARLRVWLDGHRMLMVAVLCLALGAALVIKGALGLAA